MKLDPSEAAEDELRGATDPVRRWRHIFVARPPLTLAMNPTVRAPGVILPSTSADERPKG